ncbi:MAG: cadherin domain-containing protein, partial [Alphaproteobacteria bacterium]
DAISNGSGDTESAYIYYRAYDDTGDATIDENSTGGQIVATLSASDPDAGETFTYSIADNPDFEIVGNEIRVSDGAELDFESDGTRSVEVTVTDSGGNDFTQTVTFNLADVQEAPTDIIVTPDLDNADNLTAGAGTGMTIVGLYAPGSDVNLLDGAPELTTSSDHTYFNHRSLGNTGYNYMGGNDWFQDNDISLSGMQGGTVVFSDGTTGEIDAISNGSGDTESAYIYYRAYDPDSTPTVDENSATGTVVATLGATDVDAGETFTYTLTSDASGNFEIVDNEIRLKAGADIDYETDTSFNVTVQVTDNGGNTYSEAVTLNIADVNEGPTDITLTGGSVAENASSGTVVATLGATDPDAGETFTYALTSDASGNFEIVGNEIRVKAGANLDYETDTSFNVTVQVTDSGGNTYSESVTLNVTDYDDDDHKVGGSDDDVIDGGDGDDEIEGGDGDDTIHGDDGSDVLHGGGGDTLFGDAGDDKIEAGDGNDTLDGGAGADLLDGGGGDDTFQLSADGTWSSNYQAHNVSTGENVALAGKVQSSDVFIGGDGVDTLNGTEQSDAIFLDNSVSDFYEDNTTARIDSIENFNLGAGDDVLDMTSNTYTYNTDMTVDAGSGNDTVWSGSGNDTLTGGSGNDALNGGDGNDLFIFGEGDGSDTIDGGNGGSWTDTIQLQDANGGNDIGTFGTDWTLSLSDGSITSQDANSITLSEYADGTIVLQDGSQISFEDIDQITW